VNTSSYFVLISEFGTGDIPLKLCCKKYFGLEYKKACERARAQKLPVPSYRGGSQKSEWLISAEDLAAYIDTLKEKAKHDWKRLQ